MTYYKATRVDATSFYDSETRWQVGRITRHPSPDLSLGLCSEGVLHISDAPGETLIGGFWPCRLFEVEPMGEVIGGDEHKFGCAAVKVVRELPAWQALGPNGEEVVAHIGCGMITYKQAQQLAAAWDVAWDAARGAALGAAWDTALGAARGAAWDAAWAAARGAARGAARDAAGAAPRDAARALVVRDLITAEQFDLLYGPWKEVMGS